MIHMRLSNSGELIYGIMITREKNLMLLVVTELISSLLAILLKADPNGDME